MSSHLTADTHGFVPSEGKLDSIVDFYRLRHDQAWEMAKGKVTDLALDFVRPSSVIAHASDTVRYIGIAIFEVRQSNIPDQGCEYDTPSNANRLPIVERFKLGEILHVALHKIRQLVYEPPTLSAGHFLPPCRLERLACRRHCEIDVFLAACGIAYVSI